MQNFWKRSGQKEGKIVMQWRRGELLVRVDKQAIQKKLEASPRHAADNSFCYKLRRFGKGR